MPSFFLDLIARETYPGRLQIREELYPGEINYLREKGCDLLVPLEMDLFQALIEVVVINVPPDVARVDLLREIDLHKEQLWQLHGHAAYEVDEQGRPIGTGVNYGR